MKKKKICFVVSSPLTAKAFMMNHFNVLAQYFDIYLVANFDNPDDSEFFKGVLKGCFHVGIERKINPFSDLKAINKLTKYFRKQNFFAVHSVTPKAGLVSMLASKIAGVKNRVHIFTGQVWHTQKGLKKELLKRIDGVIGKLATHILVDGKSQRQFLLEHKIISEKKSQVLGKGSISGVVLNRFVPREEIKKQQRVDMMYGEHEVVFGFLGRMNTDKGVYDLVEAFRLLYQKYPNTRLLFIGFDEENVQENIKNTLGIKFYGPTSTPEIQLQALDVFCLPSYREGFGTSIIEASLLKIPIVCSDTYGLMETIIDNKTGKRHKVKDVQSIFTQMEILYLNEDLRKSMGEEGRKYVQSYFSADTISTHWLHFYQRLSD